MGHIGYTKLVALIPNSIELLLIFQVHGSAFHNKIILRATCIGYVYMYALYYNVHLCIVKALWLYNIHCTLYMPGRKGPRDCADVARSSADLAEVRGLTRISAIIIAYVNPRYAELR